MVGAVSRVGWGQSRALFFMRLSGIGQHLPQTITRLDVQSTVYSLPDAAESLGTIHFI